MDERRGDVHPGDGSSTYSEGRDAEGGPSSSGMKPGDGSVG
jgi:hypothetical protein